MIRTLGGKRLNGARIDARMFGLRMFAEKNSTTRFAAAGAGVESAGSAAAVSFVLRMRSLIMVFFLVVVMNDNVRYHS